MREMTHNEAQRLADELNGRYALGFTVQDFKFPDDPTFKPYSILVLWVDGVLVGTYNSRAQIDGLRKVAAVIFPIDEQELVLAHMTKDGLSDRYPQDQIDVVRSK